MTAFINLGCAALIIIAYPFVWLTIHQPILVATILLLWFGQEQLRRRAHR
jgi:hypothetical protein